MRYTTIPTIAVLVVSLSISPIFLPAYIGLHWIIPGVLIFIFLLFFHHCSEQGLVRHGRDSVRDARITAAIFTLMFTFIFPAYGFFHPSDQGQIFELTHKIELELEGSSTASNTELKSKISNSYSDGRKCIEESGQVDMVIRWNCTNEAAREIVTRETKIAENKQRHEQLKPLAEEVRALKREILEMREERCSTFVSRAFASASPVGLIHSAAKPTSPQKYSIGYIGFCLNGSLPDSLEQRLQSLREAHRNIEVSLPSAREQLKRYLEVQTEILNSTE